MRSKPAMLLGCLAVLLTTGCIEISVGGGSVGVPGSGTLQTEMRQVPDFDKIRILGVGTLDYSHSEELGLVVKTDDNLLPMISTEVEDGVLVIRPIDSISPTELTYEISSPTLNGVTLEGATKVNLDSIASDSLTINVSGASKIDAGGEVNQLIVDVSGASKAELERLSSKTAMLKLSGASKASVYASEAADIEVNGVGKVDVHGNPKNQKQSVSGLGSVDFLN
ncbi:MAG: head GIN domain-containing protein [Planctomycetota bacterium]